MKKILIVLLSVFAVNVNLLGAQEEQPKQKKRWSVVSKFVKPLLIGLPLVTDIATYGYDRKKECRIDEYPYAELWFKDMGEKYPVADLKTAEFCQGTGWWENVDNRIFTGSDDLEFIDTAYRRKMNNRKLSEVDDKVLNIAEFSLLHEAGHRINKDTSLGSFSSRVLAFITIDQGLGLYTESSSHKFIATVTASAINRALAIDQSWNMEYRADKFACDYAADEKVLQGGLDLFTHAVNLTTQDDFFHPHPKIRAQKVLDEMNRRKSLEYQRSIKK